MNSDNILVKLNNVGFRQNGKWLVEGVSLQVEKGKIITAHWSKWIWEKYNC